MHLYPVLSQRPSTIIPHPNFLHVFTRSADAARGRQIMGVEQDAIVLLCFGIVRRYKGIDRLIDIFKQLDDPQLRLVVAGSPLDRDYADEIARQATNDPRMRLLLREIHDHEVPDIYAATTLNCATFRAILNSGSVMLSLSFGCPVLAPRLGSLPDLESQIGRRWIRLYEGTITVTELREAIRWAGAGGRGLPDIAFSNIDSVASLTNEFLIRVASR